MAKRGPKAKNKVSWYAAANFLRSVRDELGWSETSINSLVYRLVGVKLVGRGSRFYWRVVSQEQEARIPGSKLSFQKTMELLYEYPEFAAAAARWYRPVFHLLDALTVTATRGSGKNPSIKPPNIRNISIYLNDALEDAKLSRMTLDEYRAHRFGISMGPLVSALPIVLDADRMMMGFQHSLISMTRQIGCPYKQLNLVALLSIEACSVNDFRVHGYLRELSTSIFESCASSTVLDRTHLSAFRGEFESEVFQRVHTFKPSQAAVKLTQAVVGSPLLTEEERDNCERWRNAAFSRYAELVEERNGRDLFCWNKSWLRSFEGYLRRRGLDRDELVRHYRNNEFKNPPRILGAV